MGPRDALGDLPAVGAHSAQELRGEGVAVGTSEILDAFAALEATGKVKTPKDGQPYVAWPTYHAAVLHQNRVKERAVVVAQLRRALHIIPTIDELLA